MKTGLVLSVIGLRERYESILQIILRLQCMRFAEVCFRIWIIHFNCLILLHRIGIYREYAGKN